MTSYFSVNWLVECLFSVCPTFTLKYGAWRRWRHAVKINGACSQHYGRLRSAMVHLCSTSRVSSANSAASASTGVIIRDDHTKANRDNGVRRLETTDLDGFEPNFVDLLKLYASMANGATVKSGRVLELQDPRFVYRIHDWKYDGLKWMKALPTRCTRNCGANRQKQSNVKRAPILATF